MRIAILSKGAGNYSTKRLKEEARKRGHVVRVIDYTKCYVSVERSNPAVKYGGKPLNDIDAIIPRISPRLTKYGSSIVRQFELLGVYTPASSISIVRSRDKLRATQLLAKAGIDIPKTVFARDTVSLEDVIDEAGGVPLIVKVARGAHGYGVVLAETKKAALAVMQAFHVERVGFLVQEFISESEGFDIRAIVVGGKVVASMKRQSVEGDFRSNLHQGGKGSPAKLSQEEKRIAQKAAKAMGLSVCGVDMLRSDRGPLVLEVNSSPGFTIEEVTSKNVAGKIIEYIEQNVSKRRKTDRVGA